MAESTPTYEHLMRFEPYAFIEPDEDQAALLTRVQERLQFAFPDTLRRLYVDFGPEPAFRSHLLLHTPFVIGPPFNSSEYIGIGQFFSLRNEGQEFWLGWDAIRDRDGVERYRPFSNTGSGDLFVIDERTTAVGIWDHEGIPGSNIVWFAESFDDYAMMFELIDPADHPDEY